MIFSLGLYGQYQASLGYSPLDTFLMSLAAVFFLPIGLTIILFSLVISILNVGMKKGSFKACSMEMLCSLVVGIIIDGLRLLPVKPHEGYERLLWMLVGIAVSSYAAAGMIRNPVYRSPFETWMVRWMTYLHVAYHRIRWTVDAMLLLGALILIDGFKLSVPVGLGTLMSLVLYSFGVRFWLRKKDGL